MALLCALLTVGASSATVVVDQSYWGTTQGRWNAGVGGEFSYVGETFTAARSGQLTGIQLDLGTSWGMTNAIDFVIIRNPVIGANPVVAGRVTVPASDVVRRSYRSDGFVVDLSSIGLQVTSGQKYGFLMSAHAPWGTPNYWAIVSSDVASDGSYIKGYLRGEQISCESLGSPLGTRDDADFAFRTFVQVPESNPTAPTIFQQPFSNTVWVADAALMSVWVLGSLPLSYQWFLDGVAVPGATNRVLRIPSARSTQGGVYTVAVNNALGATASLPAFLDVRSQPLILYSSTTAEAQVGSRFSFSVQAVGKGTLRFQWFRNGVPIQGATERTYTLMAASAGDAGAYHVEVEDSLGRAQSEPVAFSVRDDSARLRWAQALDDGSSSITVDDTTSTVYVLSRSPSLVAMNTSDGRPKYRVALSDSPSCVTTPLVDGTLFLGSHELVLLAKGDGTRIRHFTVHQDVPLQPSYYMGPALAVATNGLAFLPAWSVGVTAVNWRQGTVLWEFPVDSRSAYVSGVAYDPSIQTVFFASRNTLYAVRENGSLRWRYDVLGQDSNSEIAPALGTSNLVYFARGKSLSALNAIDGQLIWSSEAPAAHTQPPVLDQAGRLFTVAGGSLRAVNGFNGTLLWTHPQTTNWGGISTSPVVLNDGTLAVGAGNYLRVVSAQDGTLLWDYLSGGYVAPYNNNISVAADGSILFTTDEPRLYALRGTATLAPSLWPTWRGSLTQAGTPNQGSGVQAPSLLLQPSAQSLTEGTTARFTVSVAGTEPLFYQWFWNDQPIPGANQHVLSLTNVVVPQNGSYRVVITNLAGSVASVPRPLTVTPLPIVVTTVAGDGTPGADDGPDGTTSRFNAPNGIDVDANGLIYVSDAHNHRLRFLDDSGRTGTLAGGSPPGFLDGPGAGARFNVPLGLKLGPGGDILVADSDNNRIRIARTAGFRWVTTAAGSGERGTANGAGDHATFNDPNDLVQDISGNIFVTEFRNHQVRRIDPAGQVTTWAGNGRIGADDGAGALASFHSPGGIAIDRFGHLYITEYGGNRIRRIAPDGNVTTLAGSGRAGLRDGYRAEAEFSAPDGICVAMDGTIFLTDHDNHVIRKVTPQGFVVTIAGDGTPGHADGPGYAARFCSPGGLALAPNGDLLVADTGNHRIRRLRFGSTPSPAPGEATTLGVELHPAVVIWGPVGSAVQIQASSQLSTQPWVVVTNLTLTNATQLWIDPSPASAARRYYRSVGFGP